MPLSDKALSEKRAQILEKVRKLIALADSTSQPGESELCRERADSLMEEFAIEMWMVEQAGDNTARTPVGRMIKIDWLYGHPFANEIWSLFTATGWHTRCIVASWKWDAGEIGVVGLEQDLDYFDLVFTHLLTEMGRRLVPEVNMDRDAEWNAWYLRTCHLGWPETAFKLSQAGMLDWPAGWHGYRYNVIADRDLAAAQAWRRKARKLYRDYCRKNGVEPEPSKQPATAAKSYAMGWSQEIKQRMRLVEREKAAERTGTGMEVALRDIRAVVQEAVERIYPRPEPVKVEREPDNKRRRAVTYKEPPFDPAAYSRGRGDAKEVNISGHPHRRVTNNPKELTE